jgi:YgiT-type zinc finger domain-containing protein
MTTHRDVAHTDMAVTEQSEVTCPQCGSRSIKPAVVRSAFWHGDRLVVVEDLPALSCGACHEQFYDDATVTILDLLRGQGFPAEKARRTALTPIFSFRDFLPALDSENEGVLR